MPLNLSGDVKLAFQINVNSLDYDNDDNPYGEFMVHLYTNMKDLNDTKVYGEDADKADFEAMQGFDDRIIPIKRCQHNVAVPWMASDFKRYCPVFDDDTFLYGNFFTARYAWMRIALHFCDDSEEAREERRKAGKKNVKCAKRDEILEYFASNIIYFEVTTE